MPIAFVEEPGTVEIDGKGVVITYSSGDEVYVRRMLRSDYRRFLEYAIRQLNAYEAAERGKVVPIRKRGAQH